MIRLPSSSSKPDTVTLRQAVGGTPARVGRREDVLVAGLAVGGGDGVVGAARELGEGHLDHLEAGGRLAVPRPVERHVHVGRVGVEGVPDGRAVRLEGQARRLRLALAVGVVRYPVARREHELLARLEPVHGPPDCEAGWVPEPLVPGCQGVTD